MLGVSLYLFSIALVAWGYWFFIHKKTRHLVSIIDMKQDLKDKHLIHFWGLLDGDHEEYRWIILDCTKWKLHNSSAYKITSNVADVADVKEKALLELSAKMRSSFLPEALSEELPFPVYISNDNNVLDDDYIQIKTEGDSLMVSYFRNAIRIANYRIIGEIFPGIKVLYLKDDQHFLMTYHKASPKGRHQAVLLFNLRTGNLIGDSEL